MNCAIPNQVAVLCLYDLSRFSSDVVMDVLQTHPRALIGEVIVRILTTSSRELSLPSARPAGCADPRPRNKQQHSSTARQGTPSPPVSWRT